MEEKREKRGIALRDKYGHVFSTLESLSKAAPVVDENSVYEEANPATRVILDKMTEELLLPDSHFAGIENLASFFEQIKAGKRGIIMSEHYSNMDLPVICYLMRACGEAGAEVERRIAAISGKKLNEEIPAVRAWANSFTRVIIYPSRSLAEAGAEEVSRGKKINMAALRAIHEISRQGKVILLFPSGTRYRPGRPETRRGVREADSYLRMFDVMLPLSINGNVLRITAERPNDMLADEVVQDTVIVRAGKPEDCGLFRRRVLETNPEDPKQAVADAIMAVLAKLHEEDSHAADN